MTYVVYLIYNILPGTEKEKEKGFKIAALGAYGFCLLTNVISLFFNLELYRVVNGQTLFETGGLGCQIPYYGSVIPMLIMTILTLTRYRKRISKEYLKAILVTSIGIVVAFVNLLVFDNALAITSVMYQYIAICIYLTNERSSIKLINEMNTNLQLLQENQQVQEKFLNTASHDVRSSLNIILGLSEGIIENRNEKDNSNQEENISSSVVELDSTINKTNLMLEILINKNNIVENVFNIDEVLEYFKNDTIILFKDPTMISNLYGDKTKIEELIKLTFNNMAECGAKEIKVKFTTTTVNGKLMLNIGINSNKLCYSEKDFEQNLDEYLNKMSVENNSISNDKIMYILLAKDIVKVLKGTIELKEENGSLIDINIPIKENKNMKAGEE